MSFLTLQNAVMRVAPNLLTLALTDYSNVPGIVNAAYRQILERKDWMCCTAQYNDVLQGTYSTGTANVTFGSTAVVGVGTNWLLGPPESLVGKFFSVGQNPASRIDAVGTGVGLTLDSAYAGPTALAQTYTISAQRLQLPGDCEYIKAVNSQYWPMSRTSMEQLDSMDPIRIWYGIPYVYADVGPITGGGYEIELWPVCNVQTQVSVTYRRYVPDMSASGDVPVMPEMAPCIERLAQAIACQILAARTNTPIYLQLYQSYIAEFDKMILSLEREDRRRQGANKSVLDSDDISNFTDPNWIAAYRQMAAASTWKLA